MATPMRVTIESLQACRPQIDEIAARFGVSRVRVFGSVARGTSHHGSDLDLLVCMEEGRSLLDLIGFEQSIQDAFNTAVDVVDEGGIHPMLESAILSEALPL